MTTAARFDRPFVLALVGLGLLCLPAHGFPQLPPGTPTSKDIPALLGQLQSANVRDREIAYHKILLIPHADTRPNVQAAFVQLLLTEEATLDAAWVRNPENGPDSVYGESYQSVYLDSLIREVRRYAMLTDSEDRTTAIALLHATGCDPTPQADVAKWLAWLAARTSLTPNDVIQMSHSPVAMDKYMAQCSLAALNVANQDGSRPLSESDRTAVKAALLATLKDPDPYVRAAAAGKIAWAHDPDPAYLKAIENMAASDPDRYAKGMAARAAMSLRNGH